MTLYDLLEVSPHASKEVIDKAYRVLARRYHPDVNPPENREAAAEMMKAINVAYEILSDDVKRNEYDQELAEQQARYESSTQSTSQTKQEYDIITNRPWSRYFARMIDAYIGVYLLSFLIIIFFPDIQLLLSGLPNYLVNVLLYLSWLFIESLIISTAGTTIGKWIFNLYIRDIYGHKLSFKTSLQRSFLVSAKGLGFGVPIISLVAMLSSYNQLKPSGIYSNYSSWDIACQSVVASKKINYAKIIVSVILAISVFYGIQYYSNTTYEVNQQNNEIENLNLQLKKEEKELLRIQDELNEEYEAFIDFENQMLYWYENDMTDEYNDNYDLYNHMLTEYNSKYESFQKRLTKFNSNVEKLEKMMLDS